MKVLFAALLLTYAGNLHAAAPAQDAFFPGTVLMLPDIKEVGVNWVVKPPDKKVEAKLQAGDFKFGVDSDGDPWFTNGDSRRLINPVKGYSILSSAEFNDVAFLGNGARIVGTDSYLGELEPPGPDGRLESGLPVYNFIGEIRLSRDGCRLYSGVADALYVLCHNRKTGQDEISVLKKRSGKEPAAKIFGTDFKVSAVAGDGDETYVAAGRMIIKLAQEESKPEIFFALKEDVTGLAYSRKAGLFYATPTSVGFVSQDFNMVIIKSPNPEIAMRGDKLYVRLARTFGVISVAGTGRFQDLRWSDAMKAVPKDVKK